MSIEYDIIDAFNKGYEKGKADAEFYLLHCGDTDEPQTNGDRIRGKSDYEMADWIADILNHCDNKNLGDDCLESCPLYACCNLPFDNIEAWLKSPVKDGEA